MAATTGLDLSARRIRQRLTRGKASHTSINGAIVADYFETGRFRIRVKLGSSGSVDVRRLQIPRLRDIAAEKPGTATVPLPHPEAKSTKQAMVHAALPSIPLPLAFGSSHHAVVLEEVEGCCSSAKGGPAQN